MRIVIVDSTPENWKHVFTPSFLQIRFHLPYNLIYREWVLFRYETGAVGG